MKIPLKEIKEILNHRGVINNTDLSELMATMKQDGLLQPIVVTPANKLEGHEDKTGYYIVAGHRRYNAAKKLRWSEIDCQIDKSIESISDIKFKNLVENIQRENTTMLEHGAMINELMVEDGYTLSEVKVRIGKAMSYIRAALTVFDTVPEKFKKDITSKTGGAYGNNKVGTISYSVMNKIESASKTAKMNRKQKERLYEATKKGICKGTNIRQVAGLIKEGVSIKDLKERLPQVAMVRVDICVDSKELDKYTRKYKVGKKELVEGIVTGAFNIKFGKVHRRVR